jgi:serine/threonine-protein kinase
MSLERLRASLSDRYTLERELGAGGMATVYLAEDLKHQRKVAIKVLKPDLAAVLGAERFITEIKTTAALQHPHILPLFDSGESDGFLWYAMPFIDGETLRAKLDRETQLGIDESVRIATDVASALHYAHTHGVIHRDIKPENILLHDGRPMVADFGIALALSTAAGGRMTETGMSLGTPHYMSPEQATAEKEITARSDVYSLGSVLYEMLTGEPPHMGNSAQQIIMKIIAEDAAPVTKLRKSVPTNVAAAVAKSLEKLPADRFESAKAFGDALVNAAFTTMSAAAVSSAPTTVRGWLRSPLSRAAVACLAVVTGTLLWTNSRPAATDFVPRLDLSLGDVELVDSDGDIAISPDGSMLAFGGRKGELEGIFLRRLERDAEFTLVQGSEGGSHPEFSPDNAWIVFARGRDSSIVKVMVGGGGAVQLVRGDTTVVSRPHWGTADQIAFISNSYNGGISLVAADGGSAPRFLGEVRSAALPFLLPDGSAVLAVDQQDGLMLLPTNGDPARVLVAGGQDGRYIEPGYLVFVDQNGDLFAQRFDLKRGEVTGAARKVLGRVVTSFNRAGFAISRGGTLVHLEGEAQQLGYAGPPTLMMVSFAGAVDTLPLAASAYRADPRFSPDGRSIAYTSASASADGTPHRDLYVYDLVTGANRQVTFEGMAERPIWSPDGTELLYLSRDTAASEISTTLFATPADNSSERRLVLAIRGRQEPADWPARDTVVFETVNIDASLFVLSLADGAQPRAFLEAGLDGSGLQVAPGGRFAIFVSWRAEQYGVYVRDYPLASREWNLSGAKGGVPRWAPDGKSVYFWRGGGQGAPDTLYQATFDPTARVPVQSVRPVPGVPAINVYPRSWDVHPNGDRFIVAASPLRPSDSDSTATPRYIVTLNWFKDLAAKVAAAGGKP